MQRNWSTGRFHPTCSSFSVFTSSATLLTHRRPLSPYLVRPSVVRGLHAATATLFRILEIFPDVTAFRARKSNVTISWRYKNSLHLPCQLFFLPDLLIYVRHAKKIHKARERETPLFCASSCPYP